MAFVGEECISPVSSMVVRLVIAALGISVEKKCPCTWRGKEETGLEQGSSKATGEMFDTLWRQCFWFSQGDRVPLASPGWRPGMLLRPGSQQGRFI